MNEAVAPTIPVKRKFNVEPTRISLVGDISSVSKNKILTPFEELALLEEKDVTIPLLQEALIYWTQHAYGLDEFIRAREEFNMLMGRVMSDDDSTYHPRMNYFLDFFTFQRPILGTIRENALGLTPLKNFLVSKEIKDLPLSIATHFHELESFRHSIFYVEKVKRNGLILKDLLQKNKYEVRESQGSSFEKLSSKIILQGYLLPMYGIYELSRGIIFHLPQAVRGIKGLVKGLKKKSDFSEMSALSHVAKQHVSFQKKR